MRRAMLLVLVALVCIVPLAGCGGGGRSTTQNDSTAIINTINAYRAAYNAKDYQKCLDYWTGLSQDMEQNLLETLQMSGEQGVTFTVKKFDNITVSGLTAIVSLIMSATTNTTNTLSPDEASLIKEGGVWKITLPDSVSFNVSF